MARISQDEFSGKTDSNDQKTIEIDASGQNSVEVPNAEFISNSEISRDGQDLVLETPQGETLVVQNYFSAEQSPLLESPDGSILTESLVNSFLSSSPEYAQTESMSDESPVGAIEEIKGEASVTRVDGSTEPLTLGSPIYKGDVIATSEEGAVNIVFIDETSMAVSNNARMAIDEYQFDPSTESGETNLSVLRGVFVFTSGLIGRDDPDDVLIDTPVGSIGIRGTIIAGNINPGGESEITVVEGAIVVKNAVMETTLSEQYESVKLGGFNDNIQEAGVMSADNVGKTYGSVTDVVPKLFSSINDTAKEEMTNKIDAEKSEEALEITEEVVEEEVQVEPVTEEIIQDPTLDPLMQESIFKSQPQSFLSQPVDAEIKELSPPQIMRIRDIRSVDLETIDPSIFKDLPLQLRSGASQLFEGKNPGDVVGRFFVEGGAFGTKTFTFGNGLLTSADGQFTLTQIAPNVVEISLVNAAPTMGASVGTGFDIVATDSAGQTSLLNIAAPTVLDAVVNLNTPGGLNYYSYATGPLSALKQIGDVNGDGTKDFVRDNGSTVDIINGTTSTVLIAQAGSSIDGIGDTNNDGYSDVIVGNPTTATGTIYQINGTNSVLSTAGSPVGNPGDQSGYSVAGIGDFDGDGKSDFAIGAPGAGANGTVYLQTSTGGNPTIAGSAAGSGTYLDGLGDIDGDGYSDVLIGNATGSVEASIVLGAATATSGTININVGQQIVAGGAAGDINGDGYDDFAISLNDGTGDINTYVVYGDIAITNIANINWLENPDNALKLNHAGVGAAPYEISALGDVNGDGFDDISVGIVGGTHYTVHGSLGGNASYVMDGAPNDGDTAAGVIQATGAGQALVGDVHFIDGGYNNLSMKGGDGNNIFSIQHNLFKNIDGGDGYDTIKHGLTGGPLDFTNINFEQISQIERIQFYQTGADITLTTENIFNLLKSSDNGSLTIELSTIATGGNLRIDDLAASNYSDDAPGIMAALQENGNASGGVTHVSAGGYDHFTIGGYDLYIDQGLTTTVV